MNKTVMFSTAGAAVALAVGLAPPAAAAVLRIGPPAAISDEALTANNDLLAPPNPGPANPLLPGTGLTDLAGDGTPLFWSGGASLSTTAANQTLGFDYIGADAGWANTLTTPFGGFANTGFTDQADFTGVQAAAGLVSFTFATGGNNGGVANSANNPVRTETAPGSGRDLANFLLAYLIANGAGGFELTDTPTNKVLILFDDGGGGRDDNHDDFGVIVTAVPVPGAAWLFGSGLLGLFGLGYSRRRFQTA
jgi:hypothetical protein